MSEKKEKAKAEPKEKTAPQLFNLYMKSVERVRALSKSLNAETKRAVSLASELHSRFGIQIGQRGPSKAPVEDAPTPSGATQPVAAPVEGGSSEETTEEPTAEELAAAARGYTPPTQMHSDAPALAGKGSQEVEQIRRESGALSTEEDSAALAETGLGGMTALQARMTGKGEATVVPVPGDHAPANESAEERSNAGGGPVTQKPKEE